MDKQVERSPAAVEALPRWEFIALAAALMALNALAIDIMLPALPAIGDALGVTEENHRQYVVSAYFGGMAAALLFFGPLSDRYGRRMPLLAGLLIYVLASIAAAFAPTFEWLLALRFVQGVGAASTRVIAVSIVRDRFGGRAMAEVMSLIFMTFMIVPVIAPNLGQLILLFAGWHEIFLAMGVLACGIALWAYLRLPESLHPEDRRPIDITSILRGFRIVLTNRLSLGYTLASTIIFAALFGFINSAQQIYVGVYGLGTLFPLVFAVVASLMAVSSYLNSRLVARFGMRRMSHSALIGFTVVSAIWFAWSLMEPVPFPVFIVLFSAAMFQFGWISSNFNAIAMEPLGHIAGTASSVQGFIQTLGGGLVGALIGQAFDGTTRPLAAGFFFVGLAGLVLVLIAERGKLFATPSLERAAAREAAIHGGGH